jgi:2-polyprenyl-3-methyl-5-hydroxy-6-metoxy-1,4-benzoquinol methylase
MRAPDMDKLQAFAGRMVGDLGSAIGAPLVALGDRLGLWRAFDTDEGVTPADVAVATGLDERYVREWASAMAAAGYLDCDAAHGSFCLSPEQAQVFAAEGGPAFMIGAFELIDSLWRNVDRMEHAFRTGEGVGWHDQHQCLFRGAERFFRPGYAQHLVGSWLPALEGVVPRLKAGARVADVGCGHGASTVLMARAFPASQFHGFDYHGPSIERARELAKAEGAGNAAFDTAAAKSFDGGPYDLVTFFDCLHDMGDPVGAAAHVRTQLAPDGAWMIVEPMAGDSLGDNLNPVGRIYYAASTFVCTPASRSQEVGLALGAQAGEARLRAVLEQAGFTRIRRAAETALNLILEARP